MEQRGNTSRTWIKLFVKGWLHGSIRWQLEPEERGTWADLISMAGECNRGGLISDNDGRPLPRSFIANQLNIPQDLLDRTIAKCQREGRIKIGPVEDEEAVIIIANWDAYQSEYSRQKKYRKPEEINPDKYKKGKYGGNVHR